MIFFAQAAIHDPADPAYYIVGGVFLFLVFVAVALYIIFEQRKNKKSEETDEFKSPQGVEDMAQPEVNDDTAAEVSEPTPAETEAEQEQ